MELVSLSDRWSFSRSSEEGCLSVNSALISGAAFEDSVRLCHCSQKFALDHCAKRLRPRSICWYAYFRFFKCIHDRPDRVDAGWYRA